MKNSGKVSLGDIAEHIGMSRMTVSRALSGSKAVSAATRERIAKVAKEMGYRPDPTVSRALSAVAGSQHKAKGERLAFLTTNETATAWKRFPHITRCFDGAREKAESFGYELEQFWALEPGRKLDDMLYARGIDGIILSTIGAGVTQIPDFDWSRFSVVEIDDQLGAPFFRVVRSDHFSSMLEAIHRLELLGYRRIGLALPFSSELITHHRWSSAYFLWSKLRRFEQEIPLYLRDGQDASEIAKWVKQNQVDAVIGLPYEYIQLKESGFNCPKHVGFALIDCQPIHGDDVVCSGIDQNNRAMGAAASELLVGLVRTNEKGSPANVTQLVCRGEWVDGQTTHRVGPPLSDRSLYETSLVY